MRRRVPRLPDAYQEVDYIQSSCSWTTEGTNWQRIATWFSPKNTSKIELKISDFTQNWSFALFWEDQSRWTRWFTIISRSYEFWVNAVFDDWTATTRTICDWWTHTIELSQSWLIVDWVTIVTPASASFTWVELNLFAMNRNGTAREFGWFKMYYCKLRDGETLVRDFVPCYRKSDSVIWMYDLVNNQFYTNAWSGTFTKGTDSSTLELKEFQVWPDEWWILSWYRDFTTATKSALEWEWWGGQWWWSWSVSSSWLTTSKSATDRSYMVSLPIQINTSAKSIRIYWVVNRSVGSWYGSFWWGIKATNTCGTGSSDYPIGDWLITQSVNCNNNSWYMWYGAGTSVLWFTGPGQWNTSNLWYSGSDITVEAIIDLDGGTCSCSYKSGSTTIWSWSTTFDSTTVKATLSGLSTNQYLSIYNRNGTWNYKYMKNFGYEIIY